MGRAAPRPGSATRRCGRHTGHRPALRELRLEDGMAVPARPDHSWCKDGRSWTLTNIPHARRCKSPDAMSTPGSSRVWLRARVRVREIRVQIPAKLMTSVTLSKGPNLQGLCPHLGGGSSRNQPEGSAGGKGPACLRAEEQSREQQPLGRQGPGSWARACVQGTAASLPLGGQLSGGRSSFLIFREVRLAFVKTYFTVISLTHLVL